MTTSADIDYGSMAIAERWCKAKGPAWSVVDQAGKGGTAPVFSVAGPEGMYALKINDERFSTGPKSAIEQKRIEQQVALKGHSCPSLVQVFDGGMFENRLFLLMSRAPGHELEKKLADVPRDKIRHVVDQVARSILFLREKSLCHRDIKSANIFASEDFETITVLDLSVLRDIYDPVGLGTDHGDQLPVVATARYSPPEYLFRLLDPGPELWHALDVYQLGALLHDLIMRRPLFEAEYEASKENRYRFAWAVATGTPTVQAHDVDQDLVFLARRALDKDWKRRAAVRVEDFLMTPAAAASQAMAMLGLGNARRDPSSTPIPERNRILRLAAEQIDAEVVACLRVQGGTPRHETAAQGADTWRVDISWMAQDGITTGALPVELHYKVSFNDEPNLPGLGCSASLSANLNGTNKKVSMTMPSVRASAEGVAELAANAVEALRTLALQLPRASEGDC